MSQSLRLLSCKCDNDKKGKKAHARSDTCKECQTKNKKENYGFCFRHYITESIILHDTIQLTMSSGAGNTKGPV